MNSPKLHPDYTLLGGWQPLAPPEVQKLTQQAVLARCRRGDGPPYEKILGERSKPIWAKASVVIWFKQTFQTHYPECITSLLAAGFPDVPVPKPKRKSKPTRKARAA